MRACLFVIVSQSRVLLRQRYHLGPARWEVGRAARTGTDRHRNVQRQTQLVRHWRKGRFKRKKKHLSEKAQSIHTLSGLRPKLGFATYLFGFCSNRLKQTCKHNFPNNCKSIGRISFAKASGQFSNSTVSDNSISTSQTLISPSGLS